MKCLPNRVVRVLFAVSFLAAFFAFSASAQIPKSSEETEVAIIKQSASQHFGCRRIENEVVDEEKFKKIIAAKECSPAEPLEVDFTRQTLISYHISGDCFVYGTAKVFRHDGAKKYKVRIKNVGGGCRAAGSFQGWLVIEKIPAGYAVEFTETRVDGRAETEEKIVSIVDLKASPETLETRQIDLKRCIPIYRQNQFVIKDRETYLKAMYETDRERCLKQVEKIDFARYTLLGIDINSGYCRYPDGLQYETVKAAENKQYLVNISYIDPRGAVCRAMSEYDLWLLVPKLPAGYEVKFEVKAREQ